MIAIIKNATGTNYASLCNTLERLNLNFQLTDQPDVIVNSKFVILPGVGQASNAMRELKSSGMDQVIKSLKQPVIGICLGMQVMFESSEESSTECLGIIPGKVKRLKGKRSVHMGWNTITSTTLNYCDNDHYFFVHSYGAEVGEWTLATSYYGAEFSSIIKWKNFYGFQFHPEKSGKVGRKLFKKFVEELT